MKRAENQADSISMLCADHGRSVISIVVCTLPFISGDLVEGIVPFKAVIRVAQIVCQHVASQLL